MNARRAYKKPIFALFLLLAAASCEKALGAEKAALSPQTLTFPVKGLMTVTEDFAMLNADWSDSWLFPADGDEKAFPSAYHHGIARIACILSTTSYVDVDTTGFSDALSRCYKVLGVAPENIEYHYNVDYSDPVWGNDQCAFSFAHKTVQTKDGERTIVFAVIRGTPLSANEWISNLNIGNESSELKLHDGFLRATTQVKAAFFEYLAKRHIEVQNASVLITGHSRGAAVANLLGAQLGDAQSMKNLFVYTFATPNVTTDKNADSAAYGFIWNIVSAEDIVPCVPLARDNWQYRKFGTTRTLSNAWNVDAEVFHGEYLPRVNEIYRQMLLRDYTPFELGPFIPAQLTRFLSSVNKNVSKYYARGIGLHNKAEKILWKVFSARRQEAAGEKGNASSAFVTWINNLTGGLVDFAKLAFVDMHANEMYLSWLLALDEEKVFSTLGSAQILLNGTYEAAVFSKSGDVLLEVTNSTVHYKSLKRPVAAWQVHPYEVVIGLPANDDFTVVVYHASHIPTAITAQIEQYDASGRFIAAGSSKRLFLHCGTAKRFAAGRVSILQQEVATETVSGKSARDYIKRAELSHIWDFRLLFETSVNSNWNLTGGIHLGPPVLYGTALISHRTDELHDSLQATTGVGTQQNLWATLQLDIEGFCHFVQDFDTALDNDSSGFSFVPAVRFSLSFKPKKRIQLFGALACDFRIADFNDAAFHNALREYANGGLELFGPVSAIPSWQLGIRF